MLRLEVLQQQVEQSQANTAKQTAAATATGRLPTSSRGSAAPSTAAMQQEMYTMANLMAGLLAGVPGQMAVPFVIDVLAFLSQSLAWMDKQRWVAAGRRECVRGLGALGILHLVCLCKPCVHILCLSRHPSKHPGHNVTSCRPICGWLLVLGRAVQTPAMASHCRDFGRVSRQLMACLNGLLLTYGADLRPVMPTTHKALTSYIKHAWVAHTSVPVKVGRGWGGVFWRAFRALVMFVRVRACIMTVESMHRRMHILQQVPLADHLRCVLRALCLFSPNAGWCAVLLPAVPRARWRTCSVPKLGHVCARPAKHGHTRHQCARLCMVRCVGLG